MAATQTDRSGQPTAVLPSLRHRPALIAGGVVVALTALASVALSGLLPGVPLRAGPLEGSAGSGTAPLRATDTGMVLGLELENRSGSQIVLDSVEVAENPGRVPLLTEPYLWDDLPIPGVGAISFYSLPLPKEWKIPPRLSVRGHVIKSGARREPVKVNETEPDETDYTGGHPEVLIEFAPPARAFEFSGITVDYHIGWQAFHKTFPMTVTMCPPNDPGPCARS